MQKMNSCYGYGGEINSMYADYKGYFNSHLFS